MASGVRLTVYAPSLPALAATTTRRPPAMLFKLRNACWGVKAFVGTGSHAGVKVACMFIQMFTPLSCSMLVTALMQDQCVPAALPSTHCDSTQINRCFSYDIPGRCFLHIPLLRFSIVLYVRAPANIHAPGCTLSNATVLPVISNPTLADTHGEIRGNLLALKLAYLELSARLQSQRLL